MTVTLTQDDKDKFENVYVEYVDPQTYGKDAHEHKDGRGSHDGASGITYFTKNPAGYTDPTDGVAVLDGSKYVIDDLDEAYKADGTLKDGQLATVSGYAGRSLFLGDKAFTLEKRKFFQ